MNDRSCHCRPASRYHSTSIHTSGRGVPPVSTAANPAGRFLEVDQRGVPPRAPPVPRRYRGLGGQLARVGTPQLTGSAAIWTNAQTPYWLTGTSYWRCSKLTVMTWRPGARPYA